MTLLRSLLAAGTVALATLAPAHAQNLVFTTDLTGAAEAPPNESPATGSAMLMIDLDASTMHVDASFAGLTAGTTAAHVHCCTELAGTGVVPPATALPSFPGFPLGVTEGTYHQTFDMLDAGSYNPAFLSANGDAAGSFSAFVAGLQAGRAYFNIHTSAFPGGEIRGFLQEQVAPIPEPGTYALMLAGLVVVGWAARRRAG